MSMQFLLDFAERDEEFRRISRTAAEYKTVQGVFLEIDPYWLVSWWISLASPSRRSFYRALLLDRRQITRTSQGVVFWLLNYWTNPPVPEEHDIMEWRPPDWNLRYPMRSRDNELLPIIVRVRLRPTLEANERIPSFGELGELSRRLQLILETRTQAILCADPRQIHRPLVGGVSIGTSVDDFGTLALTLTNPKGEHFGLTCSHVAPIGSSVVQPSRCEKRRAEKIGESVFSAALVPCSESDDCNEDSGIFPNEIDAALIRLDAGCSSTNEVLDIGKLNIVVPRRKISQHRFVKVMGRTSKLHALKIGPVGAWAKLQHNDDYYCYKKIFLVASPFGTPKIIRPGDSGAPVCLANDNGYGWCGIVAGCDDLDGYAIFAQSIEEWWTRNNYSLSL